MPSSDPGSRRELRVLVVAHNAVAESNRRRVEAVARLPATEVALLTPRWWFEEGRRIEVDALAAAAWQLEPRGSEHCLARLPTREHQAIADEAAHGGVRASRASSHGRPNPVAAPAWHIGRTLATGNGTRYLYLSRLLGLMRAFSPDVIDVHEEPFSLAALQVVLAREVLAPRAAVAFYSAVTVARRWRLPYRLAERVVLARADAAYVPNGEVPSVLRSKGYAGPLEVIPLGVDVSRFNAAAPLELTQARPRVGFVGRLEPVKGLDVLLQAAARLKQPASVLLAGDGPERGRLQRLARDLGVEARVSFVGQLPYADVPGFLKAVDVLVLPSVTLLPLHKEQFGRVLVEAMAAGVPVVGSSSGAIPEVIGDAGLVVPEGDPAGLAEALDRVLTDASLRQALVQRGNQRAATQYAWPVLAARTRELYARAVAHRQARRARAPRAKVVEGRA